MYWICEYLVWPGGKQVVVRDILRRVIRAGWGLQVADAPAKEPELGPEPEPDQVGGGADTAAKEEEQDAEEEQGQMVVKRPKRLNQTNVKVRQVDRWRLEIGTGKG